VHQVFADGSLGQYLGGKVAQLEERLRDYHQVEFALCPHDGATAGRCAGATQVWHVVA
jgi:hypothetical protein